MPGWVWVILACFFVAMLAFGALFAFRHAKSAVRTIKPVIGRAQEKLARAKEQKPEGVDSLDPIFVRPLDAAVDEYAAAHADILARKDERRQRHADAWARWFRFNEE